ncbi:amino acid adenylation domain-containing protein, partial [Photorhabdus sp. APURE]|uniref:non-ribosomal peptide synthetase n=1 Tax=Photorhabdus aballayi TaxID=2991723 RepID=UPI00223D9511
PTLAFGLTEVHRDGSQVTESHRMLTPELNDCLRSQARRFGVSLAALCHLAWAQVLSRTSGQEKVVFGTVLFGRMQAGEGTESSTGLFINTLPLRLDIDDTPVQERVRETHHRLAGLLTHEHASLALAQRCSGVASGTPLFNALLNYRHNAPLAASDEPLKGIEFLGAQERTNYPIVLSVEDFGDTLGLTAQVVQPFESARLCDYMQQALESLAEALEHTPDRPVRALEILPEAERTLLLKTWNATETVYPDQLCIHQLFEQQVERTPDATALIYEEQTLSYAELNTRANRLARQLIEQGISPGNHVAFLLARSIELVVAQLAVLKAGAVYVPVDPDVPDERKNWLISDCSAKLLLTDTQADIPANLAVPLLRLSDETDTGREEDRINPDLPRSSTELAYIMYTSGSTGTPKGVLVPHRAVVRLVINNGYAEIGPDDRVAFAANPAFDASTFEVWAPLLNGGALVVVDHATLLTPQAFVQALQIQRMTVLWLSVGLFNQLAAKLPPVLPQIKLLIVGGDTLDPHVIGQVLNTSPPQQLLNGYGPSEGTTFTTTYRIEALAPGATNIPIGRPIANTRVYLLDAERQPVPLGVTGEIYVGGDGVACGYLNRSELTAEHFLTDPFSDNPDARLYRTGDFARYLPDGSLVFIGRNDRQVKIRGFRIEPGEIEARLTEFPAVREAAVLALGDDYDKRLVAYVVAEADDELVNNLRIHLNTRLPDYMVPAAFVRLDAFPLTPNGKLDRKVLPVPGEEAFVHQIYEAPQGEIEIALAAIWHELLGIEQISRHDNFFALGGHSLLAVRMMNRIATLGVELPLSTLFESPSLIAFAEVMRAQLNKQGSVRPAIMPISRGGELPLSFAQQRLWFLSQLDGVSKTYHIPMALRLRGQLNISVLQQALDTLFSRHEALRSIFVSVDDQPQVRLLTSDNGVPLVQHDLRGISDAEVILERLSTEEIYTPFALSEGPLIRACLIQLTDNEYQFLLTQHHIVSDGWSVSVLMRELSVLYIAFLAEQPNPLLPLTIQYPDYAAWQRQWFTVKRLQAQSDYWRMMLADAPVLLDLPTDKPRPPQQSFVGNVLPIALDKELTESLKRLSKQHGVTLFMVLLSAWTTVLSRLSGQDDLVIGTPSAGRGRQEVESLIGFFVNTLALRIDLSNELNVTELLAHVRQTTLTAQENQDLPFEQVVEIVQPPRRLAHTPLFQAMFAWQNNEHTEWKLPGLTVIPAVPSFNTVKFDLELELFEEEGKIVGYLGYSTALFNQPTIKRHIGYLHTVLQVMAANPQQRVREIDILAPAERRLLLETWNATKTAYPDSLCIHQLFEQLVERMPDATALIYKEQTLSYAELNTRANRLARQLIEQGVRPGDQVALLLARSIELVVAQLAVLKAGAVYVPVDPDVPDERKNWLISDCAARLLLTDTRTEIPADLAVPLFRLPDEKNMNSEQDSINPDLPRSSTELAYIMYTSGSTGTPKGILVPHRAVVRLVVNNGYAEIGPDDRVAFTANPAFDAGTFEVWAPLLNGGTLVVIDHTTLLTPPELVRALQTHRITVLSLVVGLFNQLAEELSPALPQIKLLIVGGDALDPHVISQVLNTHPPQRLLQAYGPSEGTTFTTTYRIDALAPGATHIPIGRPIANTRVYLLDAERQPVPLGVTGEIYIGGDGVACGYLNRPELTAERFLVDPFSDAPDAQMYRTGDLARYLPDGNLEFLGRNDQQVKIRGFRIEPGEIEARLMDCPAVREAAVLALGDGPDKRLVAYVAAEAEDGLVNSLRVRLSTLLPDYMVPAAFVRLEAFPLTPNGKLDRRALPAPDEAAFARQAYEAPQGETEAALAAIWRELLSIEHISRHDNFFTLGGHSLLAVRMMNRITALGIELPLTVLFEFPSLVALAEAIKIRLGEQNNRLPAIQPISRKDKLPLSFAQQRLWFLAQLEDVSKTYHIPMALRLCGQLDIIAWQQALDVLFARHEALRSTFVMVDGQPQVVLLPANSGMPIKRYDLRTASDMDEQCQRLCTQEIEAPFDLAQGPLIRAALIQRADEDYIFLLTQHHIVSDGWSVGVLMRELNALYTTFLMGQPVPLPPLVVQYPDYAAWQRQWFSIERLQSQSDYWRSMLADAPILLDLPTDRPRWPEQSFAGNFVPIKLDTELTTALKQLSEHHGVTLFMVLLSAWSVVLSRLSAQEDIVIGTPSAGRNRQEIESLIGFFVNTLALRIDLSGALNVAELLERVREIALMAQVHQDLPFEQVVEIVQPPRRLAHTPLFQVMFAWQNDEHTEWKLPGLTVTPADQSFNSVKFDLELELFEEEGKIVGYLGYSTALFNQPTIKRHIGYLHTVLQVMAANPQQRVREIDILVPAERKLLLETWNATKTAYPDSLCIHQLFEQQVEKTPKALALIAGDKSLSYRELNTRANRLARQLIEQGIRPGDQVALLLARSIELVVAQLAVLKAGAVYVPVDPDVPDERKNWLISDCAARLLLTDTRTEIPADLAAPLFRLPDEKNTNSKQDGINPDLPRSSTELAYIMYTSGSTGTPKGILVPHRAVVRLVVNNGYAEIEPDDRVAFTANPAFDAGTFEVWAPLLNGGTLVVIDHTTLLTPPELVRALQTHRITVLSLVVGLFNQLAEELSPALPQIKLLIVGGDALDPHVINQVLNTHPPQRLLQAYGPSEGTTFTTTYRIEALAPGATHIPIGRPIANTRVYLLDAERQPVPQGVTGEIYIGGDGVACGYLNRPELTAERFLVDPFSDTPDAQMYRTGDLARYLPDGNLEFLGRNDQQVKIRGFRIEPGEIEARLMDCPAVREAAVLALGDGPDKRLVAYVAAEAEDGLVDSLRTRLSALLPDYMVPAAFVRLEAFPLTPNGKLDRRALPVPDEAAFARQAYEAPQGETEAALAVIWRELLGIEHISRHDNFFTLGGHSLLAVRMMERLRHLGLTLAVRNLFQAPVLSDLAQTLGQHRAVVVPPNLITPTITALSPTMLPLVNLTQSDIDFIIRQVPGGLANIQDIYALSPLQDGIL